MLAQGLRLTGESKDFFVRGRLELLRQLLPTDASPRRILDFGCGTGSTTRALAELFPDAHVTGVDTAERALDYASEVNGGPRVDFRPVSQLEGRPTYDLCYTNGVFHHIPPASRPRALAAIRDALQPEGTFALFENNPWNPGTRMVMARIPFDRDAQTISPRATLRLLRAHALPPIGPPRYLFFFPRVLAALRRLEAHLRHVPLGGQYVVMAAPAPAAAGR